MDLLELIRTEITALPPGPHLQGLQSVLQHIETAYKHFARGQSDADESAFTDTIYRTNQAFEGSAKEAYRVLAGMDPQRLRPFDIEKYLIKHKVFRDRILSQFTNYRTEWRNPSTHDYNLNFDEAEAFLAIVSVSAFTKLLVDEIAEKLSYLAIKKDVASLGFTMHAEISVSQPIIDRVAAALIDFAKNYSANQSSIPIESEAQLMGALSGFLSSVLPDLQITTGRIFRAEKPYYVDMVISNASEKVIIELKRGFSRSLLETGMRQLIRYMEVADAQQAILFLYSGKPTNYTLAYRDVAGPNRKLLVLEPTS